MFATLLDVILKTRFKESMDCKKIVPRALRCACEFAIAIVSFHDYERCTDET